MLGWAGDGAARSGADITAWAGHRVGPDAVFVGNLLVGGEVLEAMAETWTATGGIDLADRLLETLAAGDGAGGDARGRQSAALLVASRTDTLLDLRVDDHTHPVNELDRLLELRIHDLHEALVSSSSVDAEPESSRRGEGSTQA